MISVDTLAELARHVGEDLGTSGWVTVDQKMIDAFAELTGDRNWYHVDVERAARELPGGRTIAHGLLTLALVPGLAGQIVEVRQHGRAFNYGLNKVRYPAPVAAGARVRLRMKVLSAEPQAAGTMLCRSYTMELEGSAKPAMIAEMLSLIVSA
ncbi:MAG TPA: MaoC family dehydratase [Burkholderiaceae bacterium]